MDLTYCITALRGSLLLSRQALHVEMAVGISVYHHFSDTGIGTKKILREIYATAGQVDCLTSDSRSYQTVNRRMDRIAKLYNHIGPARIAKIVRDYEGHHRIDALLAFLDTLHLDSMDDVLNYVGEPRQGTVNTVAHDPNVVHFETKHTQVDISPEATREEITTLISKLLTLPQMAH